MGKYFGTDGARGIANVELDCTLAYKIGLAAATVLTEETHHRAVFFIGKDTRISSDMLEAALICGVTGAGADVVQLGVVPTPTVAMLVSQRADAGIMISASHNPFEYNGIKLFNGSGFKLSDEIENRIEALIDAGIPLKTGADIGRVFHKITVYWNTVIGLSQVNPIRFNVDYAVTLLQKDDVRGYFGSCVRLECRVGKPYRSK